MPYQQSHPKVCIFNARSITQKLFHIHTAQSPLSARRTGEKSDPKYRLSKLFQINKTLHAVASFQDANFQAKLLKFYLGFQNVLTGVKQTNICWVGKTSEETTLMAT